MRGKYYDCIGSYLINVVLNWIIIIILWFNIFVISKKISIIVKYEERFLIDLN